MGEAIDNHCAFKFHEIIKKICRSLFENTCIDYFCYQRLYKNGNYTFLPSQSDVARHLIDNEAHIQSWWFSTPFEQIQSGYLHWSSAKEFVPEGSKEETYQSIITGLGCKHGIDIIDKHDDYCDIFCFSSLSHNIYLIELNYLRYFIFYFRQEALVMLRNAWAEKILINPPKIATQNLPIISTNSQEKSTEFDDIEVKRYYFDLQDKEKYLTQREVIYLNTIARGRTAKEAAQMHCVDYRTIEKNLENIKNKFNCSRVTELIHLARENNIII